MDKYYKILGVPLGASKEELKKAYRKLATQHHPDRGGNAETFKEVSKAYDLLTGKRQLSRSERIEEQRAAAPRPAPNPRYYEPEPYYEPPRSKPKPAPIRVPEYVEYQYDHYEKCDGCGGKGKLQEYCKACHGTGNSIHGDPKNNVVLERCKPCNARGYRVVFICEHCKGKGSVFLGKRKRGYWR